MSKDPIGDYIKDTFENQTRIYLPEKSVVCARLDGRSFSGLTKNLDRPFDAAMSDYMLATAKAVAAEAQGCVVGYTQSDEITLILTSDAKPDSQAYFDNNVQKICSVLASLAALTFREASKNDGRIRKLPMFDCRVFSLPDLETATTVLQWRQADAIKNSISSLAQAHFSHKELQGVSSRGMKELLLEEGIDWNFTPTRFKHGIVVRKVEVERAIPVIRMSPHDPSEKVIETCLRREWIADLETPVFKDNPDYLKEIYESRKRII